MATVREHSLLERIAAGRREVRVDVDRDAITASVLRHLERLFNVRDGSVACAPDYGLPDIAGLCHSHNDPRPAYQKAIRATIDRFEPRLRNARVTADAEGDDVLKLRFRIVASLAAGGAQWDVNFRTRVDADGRFLVER